MLIFGCGKKSFKLFVEEVLAIEKNKRILTQRVQRGLDPGRWQAEEPQCVPRGGRVEHHVVAPKTNSSGNEGGGGGGRSGKEGDCG